MTTLTLAVTQMSCSWDRKSNLAEAERLVREAAAQGAGLILLQELFETPYFCAAQLGHHFDLAAPFTENPLISQFAGLARDLGVVLPISYFERTETQFYNSLAVVDADGRILGNYRKTHIPQGPGYEEKFYFTPGDTGPMVWDTAVGRIGVGICWDQWFPELARAMALKGAEILMYPTAIGSEPHAPDLDTKDHWQRTMIGHSAANMVPVMASNRVGTEAEGDGITFYGSSFITEGTGAKLAEMDRTSRGVALAEVDLTAMRAARSEWGLFRDRRPRMYHLLAGRAD